MSKCEICKYQKDCPDVVEEGSVYCLIHRRIPKNFDNEYIEKQQLINWLEDKIREIEEKIKDLNYNEIEYYDEVRIDIYQEVLDFVNKGGKDE